MIACRCSCTGDYCRCLWYFIALVIIGYWLPMVSTDMLLEPKLRT